MTASGTAPLGGSARQVVVRGSMRIAGAGKAVPTCRTPDGPLPVVTNADVLRAIDPEGAWPARKRAALERMLAGTGTTQRHWSHWVGGPAHPGEPDAVDLAAEALSAALADAGRDVSELDLVILALNTSTLPNLPAASVLGDRLGYRGPSFDLKAGCAGSLYSLQLAAMALNSGYGRVAVVGSDTMSRYVDPAALQGFLNVGDAAAALVLEPAGRPNWRSALDGAYETWNQAGVFGQLPPTQEALESGAYFYRGAPTATRDAVVSRYAGSLTALMTASDMLLRDVGLWIPHQVGLPILEDVRKALGPDAPTPYYNLDRYGNTGAASLLLALRDCRAEGRLPKGGPLALSALGGGMRWGAALWEHPLT